MDIELTEAQRAYFQKKSRYLHVVTYLDNCFEIFTHPDNGVKFWAYCKHDKDLDNNGELKKVHYHVILVFEQPNTLLKWFKLLHTTEIEPLNRAQCFLRYAYLIHDTDKARLEGKYQYSSSERFSNNSSYFEKTDSKVNGRFNVDAMLRDVVVLSRRQFAIKYGYSAILNYNKILRFSRACLMEERILETSTPCVDLGNCFLDPKTGELIPIDEKFSKNLLQNT